MMSYDPRDLFRLDPGFLRQYDGRSPSWGPLGRIVFERTYARALPELGRSETAAEVFARCTETTWGVLHYRANESDAHWSPEKAQREGQEMFRRMWDSKFLPAGRCLANLGSSAMLHKGAMCLQNCAFLSTDGIGVTQPLHRPFTAAMDMLMLGVGVGFDTRGAVGETVHLLMPTWDPTPYVIEDSREGWVAAVERLMDAFSGVTTLPHQWDYSQLRHKGAVLKTFGGVSSGPGPLMELLDTLTAILTRYAAKYQRLDSTGIVAVMNVIGRCVVAGGLRRSSELALGVWGDEPFAALKDPTELNALYARQAAVAERVESAQAIRAAINCKRAEQAGLSTFDPRRTEALRVLSGLETEYQSQLRLDTVWSTLDAEIARHPLRAWLWASNNSVLVPEDTADYSDVAARIARNGEPGLMWLHNVQRYGRMRDGDLTRGQPPIHGLRPDTAIGVNPCTTPDTLIHTRTGEYTIESLVGQSVEVWNGEGWATVVPRITGYDQPILKVTLSDGAFLKCTPSHNWYIRGSIVPVMARDLCVGDVIQGYPMPDDPVAAERLRSVVAIVDMGFAPVVYCFTESNTHRGTFNGIVTGQCGEQPLEHAESCLLVETFPGMHETPEDWHTTLKYAYLLGKAVSDIPIHDQQTQAVVSRNRRMGIGVAGIAEWYTKMGPAKMEAALDKGYRDVRRIDAL